VICEIVNDDGTMARVPDLIRFCRKHDLLMVTVADLARYRFDAEYEGALAVSDGLFPLGPALSRREAGYVELDAAPYIEAELIA